MNFLNEGKIRHIVRDQNKIFGPGHGCDQGIRLEQAAVTTFAKQRVIAT